MNKIVIAIDGFSGCGKSTTAKAVSKALHYTYIDSGAMYRAMTLHMLNRFTNLTDPKEVEKSLATFKVEFHKNEDSGIQQTFLNGLNVEKEIRSMRVSENVSEVSKIKAVRRELVSQQKRLGKHKGVVMDGRDIGTVVFPEAILKIFLTADLETRIGRRMNDVKVTGQEAEYEDVKKNLLQRDHIDSTRLDSPLVQASDAVLIDNTNLTIEEQLGMVHLLAQMRIG